MTEEEFISKYCKATFGDFWSSSAPLVYWAALYSANTEEGIQMSKDYLSIPGITEQKNSSLSMAKEAVQI